MGTEPPPEQPPRPAVRSSRVPAVLAVLAVLVVVGGLLAYAIGHDSGSPGPTPPVCTTVAAATVPGTCAPDAATMPR